MFKLRTGLLFFVAAVLSAFAVQAAENDWQTWQQLFNKMQTEKGKKPLAPYPRIKSLDVTAVLKGSAGTSVSSYRGHYQEKCITCHDGIEEVSAGHPREFGCTVCHGGNGDSVDQRDAHATLIYDPNAGTGKRNPSSLTVVEKSCGQLQCHSGHSQADRNHIQRVKKSMMATMAGMISGLRYQWAAQSTRAAKHGVYSIRDDDGTVPLDRGALPQLEALPFSTALEGRQYSHLLGPSKTARVSRHIGDSLLRQRCFQCHLDSPPAPGQYRSQGCAACHFSYSPDALYKGGDPTIPRTEKGHPAFHKMTTLTPNAICTQCHKATGPGQIKQEPLEIENVLSFPGQGQVLQDVHFEKGFECIDCHTQYDIMGDGNLYSKQNQAVEIRCETCHGSPGTPPATAEVTDPDDRVIRLSRHYNGWTNAVKDKMILSARQQKMTNVKLEKNQVVTLGKRSGRKFSTPVLRAKKGGHAIAAHNDKLECTACHSQWVPECKGCHALFDPIKSTQDSSSSKNSWKLSADSFDVKTPGLMVGPRGKVAPMLPQIPRPLTVLDEKGNPLAALGGNGDTHNRYKDWRFTNPHGYSGANLAYSVTPHSISKNVRSCASCHLSPETLGLGEGAILLNKSSSGKNDAVEPVIRSEIVQHQSGYAPDAKVTIRGEPLAGTGQTGARPLNQEEITRILRVGNCIPCHDRYADPIYQNMGKSYAFEKKIAHRKLRNKILTQQ